MLDTLTPLMDNLREDLELADPTLVDPLESDSLVAGEWLMLNSSSKGVRVTAATTRMPMQVWSQRGDTSVQAIGKIAVIKLHDYEAETDMFDGGGSYAANTELTVKTVTIDTVSRAAFAVAASTDFVHAICTKPPQLNGGKLRFRRLSSPFVKP